jgi:heat shock protein HslJ
MKTTPFALALALPLLCPLANAADVPDVPLTKLVPAKKLVPVKRGLIGSSWLAEDIGKKGVIDNARTFVRFLSVDKVAGSGGVNRFSGICTTMGDKLKFGALAVTRMAGPPAVMNQETAFLAALAAVTSYRLDDNDLLHLLDKNGNELVRLSRSDGDPKDVPEND